MFDIIGGVGVLRDCMGRMRLAGERGVDTALERQIFITLSIRRNDEDTKRRHFGKNMWCHYRYTT